MKHGKELKAIEVTYLEGAVKKAEAFSFLGDNRAVWDIFTEAKKAEKLKFDKMPPLLYPFAAVATMREGNEN